MVSIRNIERRHLGKLFGDGLHIGSIGDHPELMTETVDRRNEIIFGFRGGITHDKGIKHAVVGISKEHGLDVGIVHTDMLHTILLLVATGQLMLLDATSHIVVGMSTYHETILRLSIHRLRIDIIMILRILYQPTLILELLEVLGGLLIHARIVL